MAGEVKWIKITTDIFDDEKILLIESLPDSYAIITVWFKLLCLAGKQNNSGVFMMNNQIAYTNQMLATIFRMKEATVTMALQTFEQFGMVEIIDGVITIPNWGKHQNLDQLESKKEYMRNYMQEYRNKQKALTSGKPCKVNSKTNSKANVRQADKEREIEEEYKNKSKKKNNKKEEALELLNSLFPSYVFSDSVKSKMSEWVLYKAERKDFYTETGLKSLLRQVEKNCKTYGEHSVIDLIDECMSNLYKGIIFDKLKTVKNDIIGNTAKPKNSTDDFMSQLQQMYNEEC